MFKKIFLSMFRSLAMTVDNFEKMCETILSEKVLLKLFDLLFYFNSCFFLNLIRLGYSFQHDGQNL